jgi:hypothetical protein
MADRAPLVDPEKGVDAPEALLAAALISSGNFNPGAYRITTDDLGCWESVWDFCLDYQRTAGAAPPWELVSANYPDFTPLRTVDPTWAAKQVKQGAASRNLRRGINVALLALNKDNDIETAYSAIAQVRQPELAPGTTMINAFDDVMASAYRDVVHVPTPYARLNEVTAGGIGQGELWYYMARPEQGKSIMATLQAATATKEGFRVGYISLEMPYRQVIRRYLRILAGKDATLRAKVASLDPEDVRDVQRVLSQNFDGEFWVVDPNTNGGTVSVNQVASYLPDVDLLIIDHVGLLTNPEGKSNTEEMRVVGGVSNILRQHVIASDTAVLALNHINREGDNDRSMAPPKLKFAAESDHVGRDADVAITAKRLSKTVMVAQTAKLREGAQLRWWHRFDVAGNNYAAITAEQARSLKLDEDNEQDAQMGSD